MSAERFDVAVVGGGIVGAATALALSAEPGLDLVVLEAEAELAAHQTGNNSGVIHSGLYYKPGALKAKECVQGREALYRFCAEHSIPHERCGKVVVATRPEELPALEELERRGRANGLEGLARLGPEEIREREPACRAVAGLLVPQTGIVDYTAVTNAYARLFERRGGQVRTRARLVGVAREPDGLRLETTAGPVRSRFLVNCAGLYSDRVARLCGQDPGLRIVPFRGEYYELVEARRGLVRHLIYPVPDPRFPFLGVHFTRMIGGGVEAGPNAVLAFKREGYRKRDFSARDTAELLAYGGFWRMSARYWRMGLSEMRRSFSKAAFVRSLRALIPEIAAEDIRPAGAGVRAQALGPDGSLLDDFRIVEGPGMSHVRTAPAPAATASLGIGRSIAALALKSFSLRSQGAHA